MVEIDDLEMRRRYADAVYGKTRWRPQAPEGHLFSIDVESAALVGFRDGERYHQVWKAGQV